MDNHARLILSPLDKIFVATPLYNGTVSHHYLRGALETQRHFPGCVEFSIATGTYIAENRERLTRKFLESKCRFLLFIDSDIGWTVEDIELLIQAERDIVSGVYVKKIDKTLAAEILREGATRNTEDLTECVWVPGGFLLIQRSVIENMSTIYGERNEPLWAYQYEGRKFVGEDVAFCRRWRALGGQVWLHNRVLVKHIGEQVCTVYPPDLSYARSLESIDVHSGIELKKKLYSDE